jgi:hypothetical protein
MNSKMEPREKRETVEWQKKDKIEADIAIKRTQALIGADSVIESSLLVSTAAVRGSCER